MTGQQCFAVQQILEGALKAPCRGIPSEPLLQRSVSAAISCYRWVCLLLTTHLNMTPTTEWLENITYDELQVGQSARLLRTLSMADIQAFAAVSGDTNPAHLNSDYANDTLFHGVIAHGM